ncbi:putative molybdenum carrier protein [Aeromicrobium chenweiae]|uniref:Molybdenum cofactor carrier n=1 Tax=Aeromicrobium chenweiae TaxID=2079793 RepID=A0A2S0WKN6_9ACTN|nr:putative molybdenum carrier protein [Aeromicrobium chenweiae]AWB91903.1 molybdenum cofactor carrier [Aeromicrobium chenweiae]TGN32752.1 molybdenum cofactor carrier [Aeromicrobium chenweiae]
MTHQPSPAPGDARVRLARIVSGGQSGADRAGLDAAIAVGLEHGGWCPAGGWAEDRPEPPGLLRDYPGLREAPSARPAVRTGLNVRDSHATLIVRAEPVASPGTDLTAEVAERLGRPCLVTPGDARRVTSWLACLGFGLTLNVAGPRESEQPGIYALTRALLHDVLADDDLS